MAENKKEIETEIIIEGNLELTEDFKTEKNLIVNGNIFGENGLRYNIVAGDIDAGDIICEKRIKKSETSKTKARIFIQDKSKLEKRE